MTRNDPDVVIEPAGFDTFRELASRLYGPLGEVNGGPLHVELEDHNTEELTGAAAARSKKQIQAALALIKAGQAPAGYEPDGPYERNLAYWYAEKPEPLQVSLAILEITEPWSEAQAEAAYAVWLRRRGEAPCSCQEWPPGFGEAS
jgi:ParB-like chromosome segregation protein Spo0J